MYQAICPLSITCDTNNTEIWTNLLYWSSALSILTTWNVEVFVSLVRSRLEALLLPKFENIDKKLSRCMYKKIITKHSQVTESPALFTCFLCNCTKFQRKCVRSWRERLRSLRHRVTRPTAVREFGWVRAAAPRLAYNARRLALAPPRAPPPAAKPPPAPHSTTLQENFMRFRWIL